MIVKKERLTVGCRARILTLEEKPKQRGPDHFNNEESWRRRYGGQDVLLIERSHGSFSVLCLGKGVKELKKEDSNTVVGGGAWVPEDDMVLVDRDFDANLEFIDWYEEHEEDFCPDCGAWFPGSGLENSSCPNKKCPGHAYD